MPNSQPTPPKMRKESHCFSIHGQQLTDDYHWFRDKDRKEVQDHLHEENKYTQSVLSPFKNFQNELFKELKDRIKEEDMTVPVKKQDHFYYSRVLKGKEYPVYCRKSGDVNSKEQVLLDLNLLATGKDYLKLGIYKVSPSHNILAYSLDEDGSERYKLYFKDLSSGELISDVIPSTYTNLEWANDSKTVYFNQLNNSLRPDKIFRHRLGNPVKDIQLIYEEKDPEFFVHLYKTRSEDFIVIHISGTITSECHTIKPEFPDSLSKLVTPRRHGIEYSIEHAKTSSTKDDEFYIITNEDAKNFRVFKTPIQHTERENWNEFISHRENTFLEDIDVFANHIVLWVKNEGLSKLEVTELSTGKKHSITLPEENCFIYPENNPDFSSHLFRFGYSSLKTPPSVLEYNMITKDLEVLKEKKVHGYFQDEYETKRVFAKSHDGTLVPISLFYKKDSTNDEARSPRPCYLYGYGSYGLSMPPAFRQNIVSLVNRGFVFAIAHIRGGAEMGRNWYEDGKFLNKKNTFLDFIACSEYLIHEKYTSPDQLVICGGSAGGMLIGSTINMRPDLFKAAVAHVPFVDVVNTMLDDSLPLTALEYDEWGNPNKKEYFNYIASYSPYDNVKKQDYPNLLVTAGLNDPRVTYWEPAKWVAKLREMKTDKHPILLHVNMGAGHGGNSGRYAILDEVALEYTFILNSFGLM